MPKRQCTYSGCKAIVTVPDGYRDSPRCERHTRTMATPKRVYDHHFHNGRNIYKSSQWIALRDAYARENPLCQQCEPYGITTAGFIVDHIKEVLDGGAVYDWDNLQHLCQSCHNAKTGREAVKRRKKRSLNGFGTLSDF